MKRYIFIIISCILILLFTTKYSVLYPFNDWQDANSFETVARSILSGKILYKDIIEQKGPILYLIYVIGYVINNKFVTGMFIMEVISLSIALIYVDKIIRLFKDYKYSFFIVPLVGVALCTSRAFVHGGSAEEFSLAFIVIGIYYFIKYLKVDLKYSEFMLNGLLCGIVAMIKFNLIGLWGGFMAFVFFDKIIKGEYRKVIMNCCLFLIFMFLSIYIVFIYFIINGAVKDFIFSYFVINVDSYTDESSNIIIRFLKAILIGLQNIFNNYLFLILFPLFIYCMFKLFNKKREIIGISTLIICLFLGIYIGLRSFKYYCLPILIIYMFIIVYLIYRYSDLFDMLINFKYRYVIFSVYLISLVFISYSFANYKSYIGLDRNSFEQYRISDIIKKDMNEDTSLLNYGELDYGFYNILDIIPSCKYFHRLNIDYERLPDNYDVQNRYIKKGLVDYVVIGIKLEEDNVFNIDGLFSNYDLIYNSYQKYEKYKIHFYLFKLKTSIV